MAEIEQVIVTKFTAHVGLSALVATRVHPNQLPQRPTLPALVYSRISTLFYQTRDSSSLERPRFQFDCWAESYGAARAVAQQLRQALRTLPQSSNPRIDATLLENDQDILEADAGRYRAVVEAYIWHEEV